LVPFIDRIAFDNGRRVVALDIEGKRRPYRTHDGRFYLRIGAEKREATTEELSSLIDEVRPLGFENMPALGAATSDIDEAHLWSFLREFEGDAFDNAGANGYPTQAVLERDLLLATQHAGEVVPTIAGLLLFGRDDRVKELLSRSAVSATRFAGDTLQSPVVERVSITGNLLALYEAMMRFVVRYADLWDARPKSFPAGEVQDSPVAARANYHRAAVSEAVSNLLIHRDLALREPTTRLNIFDHSIELINPRRTAGFSPVAQKSIRYGVPQRLNPQLAAIFSGPAYGLKLPQGGLPVLLRASRLFSNRRTDLNAINDEFRVRLHGV
jgi:predicted HTH transcriptional regulator